MASLTLAACFFIGIHLGLSGTRLRDRVVAAVGLRSYMLAFTALSVAGMAWLASAYASAAYVEVWRTPQAWKPVAIALMLPAFLLVVIGLTTPTRPPWGRSLRRSATRMASCA